MVVEEDGGRIHIPTLAFLTDHIAAGATACQDYVVGYRANEGRLRFPSRSMFGSTEECSDEMLKWKRVSTGCICRGPTITGWKRAPPAKCSEDGWQVLEGIYDVTTLANSADNGAFSSGASFMISK